MRTLALLIALVLVACYEAAPTDTPLPRLEDGTVAVFSEVARRERVPADLLLALAWHRSSFALDGGHTHGEGAPQPWHGWLGMDDTQLADGAALIGRTPAEVEADPVLHLDAGAALLRSLVGAEALPSVPGAAWWPAVAAFSGAEEAWLADEFAQGVFDTLQNGLSVTTPDGEPVRIEARDLPDLEDLDPAEGPMEESGEYSASSVVGYPGRARYVPAHPNGNGGARPGPIRRVVIHTVEGSYEGGISWARNPSSSAGYQYIVRRSDGQVTQLVPDNVMGWHACNNNADTIGIEHEGHSSNASNWTDAMVDGSARLTGWLARRYSIPVDRNHIVGHGEIQPSGCAYRYDPGTHFPWARYMQLVAWYKAHGSGGDSPDAPPRAEIDLRAPKNGQQVGNPFITRTTWRRAHHLSVYLGARKIRGGLEGDPADVVVTAVHPGWKRLQVRAYAEEGVEVGRKSVRVHVRRSSVSVTPQADALGGLDYALTTESDGVPSGVRYWSGGYAIRDLTTGARSGRPDDYRVVRRFSSEGEKLVIARAYDAAGVLRGEGWTWLDIENTPLPPAELDTIGADELVGTTMRLHAAGNDGVARVRWAVDGVPVVDAQSGQVWAEGPDFELLTPFATGGEHTLTASAEDASGAVRDTMEATIHAPSVDLEATWDRVGPNRFRFDWNAPAGTRRVMVYLGSTLLFDASTGLGYAEGRAFHFDTQLPGPGTWTVGAIARDAAGNALDETFYAVASE